ncbi:hypothetical protein QR685DRAFT_450066, partial [Neurospora intermedia]
VSQASLTYTSPPRAGQVFSPHPVEPAAHYITTEDNHSQNFKRRIRRLCPVQKVLPYVIVTAHPPPPTAAVKSRPPLPTSKSLALLP